MPNRTLSRISSCVLAASLITGITAASQVAAQTPQDPGVTSPTPFDSLPASVPTSADTPGDVYVAYPVKITNGSGSAIYAIRISGNASSVMQFEAAYTSAGTSPFTCETTPSTSTSTSISFTCSVDPLYSIPAGQELVLPVAFKIPATTIRTEGSVVNFQFTALFREGLGNGSTSSDGTLSGTSTTTVAGDTTKSVAAFVPTAGTTFFTGKKGIPQGGDNDKFATQVVVPTLTSASYANGKITELDLTECPIQNMGCKTEVTIDVKDTKGNPLEFDPSAPLKIFLRRDSSDFKGSVNNIHVFYLADGQTTFVEIYPCANVAVPLSADVPRCIYSRKVIRKNDPEYLIDPNALGDAQIEIWALRNGRTFM